jgi:hypothetical protein
LGECANASAGQALIQRQRNILVAAAANPATSIIGVGLFPSPEETITHTMQASLPSQNLVHHSSESFTHQPAATPVMTQHQLLRPIHAGIQSSNTASHGYSPATAFNVTPSTPAFCHKSSVDALHEFYHEDCATSSMPTPGVQMGVVSEGITLLSLQSPTQLSTGTTTGYHLVQETSATDGMHLVLELKEGHKSLI